MYQTRVSTEKNRVILDPTLQIPEPRTWSLANWTAYSWARDDSGSYLVSQHAFNCRSSGCNSQTSSGYALTTDCKSGYDPSRRITEGCIVSFVFLLGLLGKSRLTALARTKMPLIELVRHFRVSILSNTPWLTHEVLAPPILLPVQDDLPGTWNPNRAWFQRSPTVYFVSAHDKLTVYSQPSSARQCRKDHDSCILHQPRVESMVTHEDRNDSRLSGNLYNSKFIRWPTMPFGKNSLPGNQH